MEVIFLGTGTSQGVPMIACDCAVCRSPDPRNHRSRTSVHVVMDGLHIQIDAAPELRLQCIRNSITWVDLFILTHGHSDHIAGMDDLRRFCDLLGGKALKVYATPEGITRMQAMYPYAMMDRPVAKGYAAFKVEAMPALLEFPQGRIESTLLPHGSIHTLGLVFTEGSSGRKFAYYTDCKTVPEEALRLAKGADLLVLDGLRYESHPSHLSIGEAVQTAQIIQPARTLLTHMTHSIDYEKASVDLPVGIGFAYDGLREIV